MSKFEITYIRLDGYTDSTVLTAEDEDHAVEKFFVHYPGATLLDVQDRGEVF